jgi:hypothetical protein
MLKNLGIACLVWPLVSAAVSDTYVSEPPSFAIVRKNITDIKKEITILENVKAQKIYDRLAAQKKEINDKNLLEIYNVILSFLKIQSNTLPEEELQKKLNSLLDSLNWLYSDHTNEKFYDKVTYLGRLLKRDFFIHLNHQKMSECLDIANRLKDIVEYSSLNNEITPEDGPDYFSPDFFLKNEITIAQQIYIQIVRLEDISKSFSKNVETLTKEQLISNIKKANNFINKLKSTSILIDDKRVRISRNTRKHLKNLTAASIEKLIERKNQLQ